MSTLDPKSEATVERWLASSKPLSEKQKDVIATAFGDALKKAEGRRMIVIPASPEEAMARLGVLGLLSTASEWERACLVRALTKPGRSGRQTNSATFGRLSFSRFAKLGIHGLTSHTSVSYYWYAWQRAIDAGIAVEVSLGDQIDLPTEPWSDFNAPTEPNVDDAVTAALEADPRAVADEAWAELKERKKIEAERNEAARKSFLAEEIQGLMTDQGLTREEAEKRAEEEKKPWIDQANRKAKRAEVRAILRQTHKIGESVHIVVDTMNAGEPFLTDKELEELQEASDLLEQLFTAITDARPSCRAACAPLPRMRESAVWAVSARRVSPSPRPWRVSLLARGAAPIGTRIAACSPNEPPTANRPHPQTPTPSPRHADISDSSPAHRVVLTA
jgi:hypothetical protein